MPEAFHHEQIVKIDGEDITLCIDFRAIDATEQLVGRDYDEIVEELQQPSCLVGTKVRVLWGLLREYHPNLTFDQIVPMLKGKNATATGLAIKQLLVAAFPTDEK